MHYACLGRSIPFEKNAEYEEERERKKVGMQGGGALHVCGTWLPITLLPISSYSDCQLLNFYQNCVDDELWCF